MLGVVVVISDEARYADFARVGIDRLAGPIRLIELRDQASLAAAYENARAIFAADHEIDYAVFLHEDTEICDPRFEETMRTAFAEEADAAIGGVIGARNVRSIAWWHGECFGSTSEPRGELHFSRGTQSVEAVDGQLLVLSREALESLRFGVGLPGGFHGYDVDICFAARARDLKVIVFDSRVYHHTRGGYGDRWAWLAADRAWRQKWGVETTFSERMLMLRHRHWVRWGRTAKGPMPGSPVG